MVGKRGPEKMNYIKFNTPVNIGDTSNIIVSNPSIPSIARPKIEHLLAHGYLQIGQAPTLSAGQVYTDTYAVNGDLTSASLTVFAF